jgi:hypothetical protein
VKELDVLLKFADERGCLHRFVPTIESRNKQRDEAINELRIAYTAAKASIKPMGADLVCLCPARIAFNLNVRWFHEF